MSKIKRILISILPGIFLIGYNIGTGSISTMSKAGAMFGMDLLWAILVSCIITYYLIVLFSRHAMVAGETFIQGVKDHIHPSIAIILLLSLSTIIVSALIGVLGIIAEVLQTYVETEFLVSTTPVLWAFLVGAVVYILLWFGNYSFFEKVLAGMVFVMAISFIVTAVMFFPSLSEFLSGFIPTVPTVAEGSDNSPMAIIAGMVGTTVSVFVFVIRSQIIRETGWKMSDNALQKRDALVSASLMFLIGASIMITAAVTLHVQELRLNSVVEMIPLLEPLAGEATLHLFVVGLLAAGLSSHLPNMLVIPWLIIDYKKEKRNTTTPFHRAVLLMLTAISIAGVGFGFKPIFIMILSQACLSVVLPLAIGCIFF